MIGAHLCSLSPPHSAFISFARGLCCNKVMPEQQIAFNCSFRCRNTNDNKYNFVDLDSFRLHFDLLSSHNWAGKKTAASVTLMALCSLHRWGSVLGRISICNLLLLLSVAATEMDSNRLLKLHHFRYYFHQFVRTDLIKSIKWSFRNLRE